MGFDRCGGILMESGMPHPKKQIGNKQYSSSIVFICGSRTYGMSRSYPLNGKPFHPAG